MITLAHISDVHLAPLPAAKPWELLNKRITGYLNWKLVRQRSLDGSGLAALVDHLHEQNVDFTAITGDLVNVALPAEISRAAGWLTSFGPPERVCVSPGNHDAYVPGALDSARKTWGSYLTGETIGQFPFPYVRRVGEVAVVACSSAISTAPWIAAGRFGRLQARRLAQILKDLGEAGCFRVVLIHHPPNIEARDRRRGLWGADRFRAVIAQTGAELILHGHTHRSSMHSVPGPDGDVPVIGVASAGARPGGMTDDPARYNVFRIERDGDAWCCTMREFGYQRIGTDIVMRLQVRIY